MNAISNLRVNFHAPLVLDYSNQASLFKNYRKKYMLEIVLFNRNIEEPTTLFWNVYAGSILVWKMNVHPLMLTFTRDWYGAISLY